jgi:hypothetical protein
MVVFACKGRHPAQSQLIGRQFAITTEGLLCARSSDDDYSLRIPGEASDVPMSIKDFQHYGDNWHQAPEYVRINGEGKFWTRQQVVAVVPSGSAFKVAKVTYSRNSTGYLAKVWAISVTDPDGHLVEINSVFLDLWGKDAVPRPNPEYLREVSK